MLFHQHALKPEAFTLDHAKTVDGSEEILPMPVLKVAGVFPAQVAVTPRAQASDDVVGCGVHAAALIGSCPVTRNAFSASGSGT
jgi:hypothetical protein